MKKTFALVFVPLFLICLVSACLAGELTLKPSGPGKWTIYDADGQDIGTLGREGEEGAEVNAGGYSVLPKGGQYLGIIRSDGNLQLSGRHPVITPSDARLYLDVLDAIKKIN
jgi:hypothetical protein